MNKNFNQFLLQQEIDVHPRSWICIKGKNVPDYVNQLKEKALNKNKISKEKLGRIIAENLNCSTGLTKPLIQGKRSFYPIPFLIELSKMANKKGNLNELNKEIELLKVNSASAKPVKAIKKLDKKLCKIMGSFMADGSLSIQTVFASKNKLTLNKIKKTLKDERLSFSEGFSKSREQHYVTTNMNKLNIEILKALITKSQNKCQLHYNLELSEEYEDSVRAFNQLMFEVFNVSPTSFKKKKNAWRTIFANKIIARYLTSFFDVVPGPKSTTAFEPTRIKNSKFSYRKAFALGLVTFDGCITNQGKMIYTSKSKYLIKSLGEIWEKDNIQFGKYYNRTREEFTLSAYLKNKKEKILEYLEPKTQKWKLLKYLNGEKEEPSIKERKNSKISCKIILKEVQKMKTVDTHYLTKTFKCGYNTTRYYLKTLSKRRRILLSNKVAYLNIDGIDKNSYILLNSENHKMLFQKIKEVFGQYNELAKFIGTHKATLSAWNVRKSRIPLHRLIQICRILNLDVSQFCKNVETDREIVQFISQFAPTK